jgi:hypothetical protein
MILWNKVTNLFNVIFKTTNGYSTRCRKQLRQHYENNLMYHLKKGQFSNEEKQQFDTLRNKKEKSLKEISQVMGRTYQSVKNFAYIKANSPNSNFTHSNEFFE